MSIWRLLLLAVLVHLFRRLPVVTALYKFIPAIRTWREAVFTGWFGPMGVGSVFYCTVAIASFAPDGPNAYALQLIEPIVYFIVLSSVLVHGITVPLFHIGKIAHISLSFTAVSVKSSEVDEETLVSLCMSQKNTQKLFTDLTFFFVDTCFSFILWRNQCKHFNSSSLIFTKDSDTNLVQLFVATSNSRYIHS